jgi:[acyl-carrier-protein] S-malonyltransferase
MTTAFIFPGQGSQKLGMMQEWHAAHPQVANTFAQASSVLGEDLWAIAQNDQDKLNQTQYTQPILLTASVAMWRVMQETHPVEVSALAGHSLGEYSALTCAGVLSLEDAVSLVHQRGQFMQQAVPAGTGAMAAILGLGDEEVKAVCVEAAQGDVLSAVNFNSPGQVVVAGHKAAVERAAVLAKDKGAKRAIMLPVSVPSHCALMKGAAEQLSEVMANMTFNTPSIPVVQNVDGAVHDDIESMKATLLAQLYQPVLWGDCMNTLAKTGVTRFVECGPGKVLTGLGKRIITDAEFVALDSVDALNTL